jgi:hypothetical protein
MYNSWSERVAFRLVSIVLAPAFEGLLSYHDCSALSLTHPVLTRSTSAQRLMLRHLSINTGLQVRNALGALQVHHDLLPLVDTLHLDTRMSDVASLPTCSALLNLVSP